MSAPTTDLATALLAGTVVLDGGLATELERRGHDLSSSLWSARVLREEPGEVVAAHRAFVEAGARVLTTASYQASFEGLAAAGVDADGTRALLRRSVELAREAAGDEPVWVAASVGPYGAARADGSEYTGAYGDMLDVAALRRWHRERLRVLADAGADVLALETVPCLAEAQALVEEAEAAGVRAWLSLTTVTTPDGRVLTRRGEPAEEAFALASSDAVVAVGVNCTEPAGVPAAVRAAAATGTPVVVYPNSGEGWDAATRAWTGATRFDAGDVGEWLAAGARLVGGCCRVTPSAIAALAAGVGRNP
ncbi:MAG TPA: homocysteine S-methyltransferase [Kineosporiaceae bacterium]|nr:homocysteine S-methyltransferase [Kineosporiaceae bacterium]